MKAMKEELKWVRSNAKARQTKSKARLARFEELSDVEYQKRNETNEIFIPVAERLGNEVIEFKGVSKSFGDRLLIDNLSFKVPAGAIVGIIGPNGAGKSTLFRMIQGVEKPDSRRGDDRQDRAAGLRRPEPPEPGRRQDGVGGRLRRAGQHRRRQVRDAQRAPTWAASTSRATTSRSWSAACRAASAAACTWPRRWPRAATC